MGESGEIVIHTHDAYCYDNAGNLICTLPERESHAHTDACYREVKEYTCTQVQDLGHTHTGACYAYDKGELICGMEEGGGHVHTDACYPTERVSEPICGMEEAPEGNPEGKPAHTHDESCFTVVVRQRLKCGMEESDPVLDEEGNVIQEGHHHDSSCYMTDEELRICGMEEGGGHVHTETCWEWTQRLICAEEERAPGHIHTEDCYETTRVLACQEQELIPHTHDASCRDEAGNLICGKQEVLVHQHTDACRHIPEGGPQEVRVLICGKEEHVHSDACYVDILPEPERYYCGLGEHIHNSECYFESGELRCTLQEHMHTAECLEKPLPTDDPEESDDPARNPEESDDPAQSQEPVETQVPVGVTLEEYPFVYESDAFTVTYHITGFAQLLDAEGNPVETTSIIEPDQTPEGATDGTQGESQPPEDVTDGAGEESLPPEDDGEDIVEFEDEYIEIPQASAPRLGRLSAQSGSEPEGSVPMPTLDTGEETSEPGFWPEESGSPEDALPQESELDPALTEFGVEELDENDPRLQAIKDIEAVQEGTDPILQQAIALNATWNGMKLDLAQCEITAVVKPSQALLEAVAQGETGLMGAAEDGTYEDEADKNGEDFEDGVSSEDGAFEDTEEAETALNVYTTNGLEGIVTLSENVETGTAPESGIMTLSNDGIMYLSLNYEVYPDFTVRYVSQVKTVATDIDKAIENAKENGVTINKSDYEAVKDVINTSGGKLPQNGKLGSDMPTTTMYLHKTDHTVLMRTDRQEIYKSRLFNYSTANKMDNIDIVTVKGMGSDNHYKLAAVQVRYKDENSETGFTEWTVKTNVDTLQLTNREQTAAKDGNFLYLKNGCEMELIYETQTTTKNVSADFYDYDVSDGKIYTSEDAARASKPDPKTVKKTSEQDTVEKSGKSYIKVGRQGINSGDYGSGMRYAFGNSTGVLASGWGNLSINYGNAQNFGKCSFGIVKGIENGDIVYAGNINGPKLFAGGAAAGKTKVNNVNSLTFKRDGDTHTLTSAGSGATANNLEKLQGMDGWAPAGQAKPRVFYNYFWPMDEAETWGADGHDIKFGDNGNYEKRKGVGISVGGGASVTSMAKSNDGPDHNAYYGMTFKLDFELPKDYVGPLEYYFFGDDDMWVFLDGKLVCDIGGVHNAVGEYVNLWDYIPENEKTLKESADPKNCTNGDIEESASYHHELTFFYVERGASGSTCWMQYTLPSVTSSTYKTPTEEVALHLEKLVEGVDSGETFNFDITLTDANGEPLKDLLNAKVYKKGTNGAWEQVDKTIDTAGTIKAELVSGQSYIITGLPPKTKYTITETNSGAFVPSFKVETRAGSEDGDLIEDPLDTGLGVNTVTGSLDVGGTYVVATCTNRASYELPATGGTGVWYTMAGLPWLTALFCVWYKKNPHGKGAVR